MKQLLNCGIDYTTVDDFGNTILHFAARYGGLRTLEVLGDFKLRNVDVEARDKEGRTPTDLAQERTTKPNSFRAMFEALLVDIRMRNEDSESANARASELNLSDVDNTADVFFDAHEIQEARI